MVVLLVMPLAVMLVVLLVLLLVSLFVVLLIVQLVLLLVVSVSVSNTSFHASAKENKKRAPNLSSEDDASSGGSEDGTTGLCANFHIFCMLLTHDFFA